MTDIVTPEKRSQMMSGIRGKDTKPEILIRKALFALGWRYRLHDKSLPGKPDLVFRRLRAAIFVDGCFWHGHDCHLFRLPATRAEFWTEKIARNRIRDRDVRDSLQALGWRHLTVRECAVRGRTRLPADEVTAGIISWLESGEGPIEIKGRVDGNL